MPTSQQIERILKQVHDQKSFFKDLLATTLEWPLADVQQIDDIAYGWSQSDLNATGLERSLIEGSIWQIQPSASGQPWGIFVLEFKDERSLSPRSGLAGVLRTVLKGLVGSRRKDATLPSWKREHLLFICTHNWTSFRFAYYRSKSDEPRSARLTTFGWSHDTSNRTVVEFNLPALAWPEDTTDTQGWVSAWAKAFDKEPLTKDFFKRFDKALDVIKADLEQYQDLSSAEAYTQSQLLLERLIFLYFLQNRGWLNQELRYLVSRLDQHTGNPEGFTYYHDFLDKLFWTLSTAPSGADRLPGIPFLNGGLFDDDEFRQPAITRKATPPLKVRNHSMQLVFRELLEAFNFTVTEDTPLNQEVAVDPEMLGKVFESIILHAEAADPDAIAPDKRKATGSYYTPRIVVHFICQEVLHQYLLSHLPGSGWGPRLKTLFSIDPTGGMDEEAKQLLKKTISPEQAVQVRALVLPLKCCDPAVGSGAFPVGLMHELVNLRRLLETVANGYKDPVSGQGSEWLHKEKAQIVENCLYGVDIQQQAIEICRLRLWLSLIVDYDLGLDPFTAEKSQFSRAIERISQLPNLEMNFRRGDSLHDHISGVPVVILPERASRHAPQFAAISKLGAELHKAKKAERKKTLRLDILEKRLSLSRAILDEELKEIRTRDSSLDTLFGIEESASKKRDRNQREIENLKRAFAKVDSDQKELEKLKRRDADSQFYPKLRKLEGADFDSPFNFAWSVDFPGVFAGGSGGFDIVVGNPPFVTARNPKKRELWRQRWPRVCTGTYQLVSPFVQLGFELLRPEGELGYIVSNAFWKRDFGEPLVAKFLPSVDIQKVVDCSGLLFPGHGTPTCLIFGRNGHNAPHSPVRLVQTQPGGGDLRSVPEDSALWASISRHHSLDSSLTPSMDVGFVPLYEDFRIAVGDCRRDRVFQHPASLFFPEWPVIRKLESECDHHLLEYLQRPVGFNFMTHQDDVYKQPEHVLRFTGIKSPSVRACYPGSSVRNWSALENEFILSPYDANWNLMAEKSSDPLFTFLKNFKDALNSRAVFEGGTYADAGVCWYQYHQVDQTKSRAKHIVVCPEISTHTHAWAVDNRAAWPQTVQVCVLKDSDDETKNHLVAGILNSSAGLFWLKQRCFNKGAGAEEQRDRFVFAGAKLQQLPLPRAIAIYLGSSQDQFSHEMAALAKRCGELGKEQLNLKLKRLFGQKGEAYARIDVPDFLSNETSDEYSFSSSVDLLNSFAVLRKKRHDGERQMIALQEEMDWLIYSAYGLVPPTEPRMQVQKAPLPIDRDDRPFRLWERAEGNFDKAVSLIPTDWDQARRRLWDTRLTSIRDHEHIRRIEQPVYKRRWDEQWKVGNQWRCGEIAYAAEFVGAFEWWLNEKAEWWLEHKKHGGPAELGEWTQSLWKDERIQAAWPVAAEQYAFVDHEKAREKAEEQGDPVPVRSKTAADFSSFARMFKTVVDEETVPVGFPFGMDYAEIEKKSKKKVPAQLKKVRGKLNVPRERFHSVGPGQYKWAGLQFRNASQKAGR
jgi:type I restriction-modification system DNA methylase subunit